MEDFVELKEYPNYSIAHSPPRLLRLVGGKYLVCKQTPNSKKDNYWTCTVRDKTGKSVKSSMHRLLMQTFVPNPENKAHVNHIDGDKSNNCLTNIEWATPKENAQHAIRTGLTDVTKSNKEVHQYTLSGLYVGSHISGVAASKNTGIEETNIRTVACGRREQAGFFQWTYEKVKQLPPTKTRYVSYYLYEGKEFKTIRDLAEYVGLRDPIKAGIKTFSVKQRQGITTVYRE